MGAVQSRLTNDDWRPVLGFGGHAMGGNLEGSGWRGDGHGQIGGEGIPESGST